MFEYEGFEYTLEEVTSAAQNLGLSVDEYVKQNGLKEKQQEEVKTEGTSQGAVVPAWEAPAMESKSVATSSESQKKPNYFQQIGQAWSGGQIAADLDDIWSKAVFSSDYAKNISDEDVSRVFELLKKQEATALTEGEREWEETYDAVSAVDTPFMPDWFAGAVAATMKNPGAALLYGTRSLAMGFSAEVFGGAIAGAGTGAAGGAGVGLAAGAISGPGAIVTTTGGAIAGGIKGAMAGVGASVELFASFGETLTESLPENYTEEDIKKAFQNPELVRKARNRAIARSGTIALFDLIAYKGAGAAAKQIGKATLKKGVSKLGETALKTGATATIGSTGEFVGELAAQKAAGDKTDMKEAVLEVFGISPTSATQAFQAKKLFQPAKYSIQGRNMTRKEVVDFIDDNDGIDLAKTIIKVENDQALSDKLLKKQGVARAKVMVPASVTNEEARDQIAELEFEMATMAADKSVAGKKKKAEIKAQIEEVLETNKPKKGRPSKETLSRKEIFQKERETLVKAVQQQNIVETEALGKSIAEKKGMEFQSFDNTREFLKAVVSEAGKQKQPSQDLLSKAKQIGGLAVGNKIFINKEVAAKTGQINVGVHEVLHPIVNSAYKNLSNLNQALDEFKQIIGKDMADEMENQLSNRGYTGEKTRALEYLNVFSDALADKNNKTIVFKDNVFTKLNDWIAEKILRPLGFKKIGFENGKQVYRFMRELNKSVKKGELTKGAAQAIEGVELTGKPISEDIQLSKMASEEINKLADNEDGTRMTKDEWYNKEAGFGQADMAIAELYDVLEPLIGSKITSQMRELPNFSEEDFITETLGLLIQHIRNFNPEKNDNLYAWITSQLANKAKSALKSGKVADKTFTSEIDERSTTASGERFDMYEDDGFNFDEYDEETDNFIDPRDLFGPRKKEYQDAIHDIIKGKDIIDSATFKKLDDLLPEYTSEITGIPAEKLGNPKTNLSTAQAATMQQFVIDNVNTLIKLLPEGAVMEAASEKVMRTGMGIPRKLLNAFYTKQARGSEGAGLSPFQKNKKITKADFFEPFAIKPDGTPIAINGKDSRAQALFALGRLVGKIATNTATRIALEAEQVNRQVIIDIGAGRSEFQLSQMPESPTGYIKSFNDSLETNREYLKSRHGLSDSDINEILQHNINYAEYDVDENGNPINKFKKEDIENYLDFANNISSLLPKRLTSSKTFVKQFLGYGPRNIGTSIDWKSDTNINKNYLLDKDGKRIYNSKDIPGAVSKDKEGVPGYSTFMDKESDIMAEGSIFSKHTKDLFNVLDNLMKEAKVSSIPFITHTRSSNLKGNFADYARNGERELFIEQAEKETRSIDNRLRVKGLELAFNIMQDIFENLPNSEKKEFLKKAKVLYGSTTNNHYGAKGGVWITGFVYSGIDNENIESLLKKGQIAYDEAAIKKLESELVEPQKKYDKLPKGKEKDALKKEIDKIKANIKRLKNPTSYYYEHINPGVSMQGNAFSNLITGKRNYILPEAYIIPTWLQKKLDANAALKTADPATRKAEILKYVNKEDIITYEGAQFSLAPVVDSMIDNSINDMASRKLGIENKAEISDVKAKLMGQKKGKYKFWVPPSADDFMGLMQYLFRKGTAGDADAAWIKDNIMKPFSEGIAAYEVYKQGMLTTFRRLKKELKNTPANLKKTLPNGFTVEQAVRVALWAKKGMDIPGISKQEQQELVKLVGDDKNLSKFASEVSNMMAFDFPEPQENWIAGTLTTDLLEHVNEVARSKFLEDFINVSEEAFGKLGKNGEITGPTANKLRAAFGDNYVEALSDVLYRMKNGRAREFGKNRLVGQFTNWINNAVGNVMFFNTRSALLQQLSIINFINWSDNNPLKMMQTWEDGDQFWKDYTTIFNSDFLKQRRGGLKTDVNADDIAREAETSTNKMKSALAGLLKMGFLPTQIADSNAIALGGASFYRNRINTYLADGFTQEKAEEQAFLDFKEIAEESQQSSRPDLVSQQQASGLGRIVLAFANTPMQYARLTKKAAKDLVAGRGDWKTNASKMLYYGAVQNVIFTWLQQGLFAMLLDGEDDDDKDMEKYMFALNSTADGILRGLGYGGAIASTGKNMILEAIDQYKSGRPDYTKVALESTTISPPINSKLKAMMAAGRTFTWKQERKKIKEEGFSLDNPAFYAAGQVSSAVFNVPLHRVIRKMDNATYAMRHETETWQAIFLQLGYGQWELGLKDTKKDSSKKNRPKVNLPKRKKIKR